MEDICYDTQEESNLTKNTDTTTDSDLFESMYHLEIEQPQ